MRHAMVLAAVAFLVAGCATARSVWRTPDEDRFNAGVRSLANGEFAQAHTDLRWVAERFANQESGRRAILVLSALELDPRNPQRRPEIGADLAAAYLRLKNREVWLDGVAHSLYLVGLELGSVEQRIERAEALPKLPGPTVTARIKNLEQERDRLARRVNALETELAEKTRELERIRKTIKP